MNADGERTRSAPLQLFAPRTGKASDDSQILRGVEVIEPLPDLLPALLSEPLPKELFVVAEVAQAGGLEGELHLHEVFTLGVNMSNIDMLTPRVNTSCKCSSPSRPPACATSATTKSSFGSGSERRAGRRSGSGSMTSTPRRIWLSSDAFPVRGAKS